MQGLSRIVPQWDVPANVGAMVTTRLGGHSQAPYASLNLAAHVGDSMDSLLQNLAVLEESLPGSLSLQWLRQEHGSGIALIDSARDPINADALLTQTPGVACCVLTADCLPVLLASARGDEVAIVHAGWRGMAAGLIEKTVHSMSNPPEQLHAWLGPAIGRCHFEVGEEVRRQLLAGEENPADLAACFIAKGYNNKYMADLYGLARCKLHRLRLSTVTGGDLCTYCDSERFFSYRRDGTTGRMASLIYIEEGIQ